MRSTIPCDNCSNRSHDRFYNALVSNFKNKYKEIYASAAEVLGMVLHYIAEKKHV